MAYSNTLHLVADGIAYTAATSDERATLSVETDEGITLKVYLPDYIEHDLRLALTETRVVPDVK